ncbi:MAG: hypothetical protein EAZ60_10510 [Oscillatoriales cyanobacterium]|nr:MAG: hypothetical protein EAZ60_10510 [Oscillatoriales cyanobacterium]
MLSFRVRQRRLSAESKKPRKRQKEILDFLFPELRALAAIVAGVSYPAFVFFPEMLSSGRTFPGRTKDETKTF